MVGSVTLDRLGRNVGDRVSAVGLQGGTEQSFTIVGRGVFPEFIHPAVPDSDTGSYNDFALFTEDGNQLFAADAGGEYFSLVLVNWAVGVDVEKVVRELEDEGVAMESTSLPSNLQNLTRVRAFPLVVAAFLILLAVAALTHALVMSVQRKAGDLAVLKTLGFVTTQIRATLAAQASTVAAVGIALGIPAGVLLGRAIWAVVARNLGVESHASPSLWTIALIIPATLILSNLIAVVPARSAVRARVDSALRRD
jgi:ABC-type antimicrobial peptide transport system permease subunit